MSQDKKKEQAARLAADISRAAINDVVVVTGKEIDLAIDTIGYDPIGMRLRAPADQDLIWRTCSYTSKVFSTIRYTIELYHEYKKAVGDRMTPESREKFETTCRQMELDLGKLVTLVIMLEQGATPGGISAEDMRSLYNDKDYELSLDKQFGLLTLPEYLGQVIRSWAMPLLELNEEIEDSLFPVDMSVGYLLTVVLAFEGEEAAAEEYINLIGELYRVVPIDGEEVMKHVEPMLDKVDLSSIL